MPAGDATIAALTNILKTRYDQKVFHQLFYRKAPAIGMMRKDERFGGNNARISLRYGAPQGGSFQLPIALANVTSSADVGFMLTRAKDYQVSGITGEALAAGDGDENTLYNTLRGEMEGSMRNLNRSVQIALPRNGGGQRGQGNGSYTITGTVLTLLQAADITGFEVGMRVDFSIDDGYNNGGALAGIRSGGPLIIVALDRTAGTITFNVAISPTLAGVTNSDYIFRNGDYSLGCAGWARWLPASAPTTGDSHFGVDRSVDPVRLAGIRYSGQGGAKEETIIDAAELAAREGAEDLTCFINNLDRADVIKGLGAKAIYEPAKDTDGVIGYRSLNVEGPDGTIKIISDVNIPRGRFYLLDISTWVFKSAKAFPRVLEDDGMKMIREAQNDGYQWRMGGYFQPGCEAPGYNLAGTW
jgi:hypothetical protein